MLELVPRDNGIILSRDIQLAGDRARFFAAVQRQEYVALRRGAYLPMDVWSGLSVDERYRSTVVATATLADADLLFSHHSAAALLRLPWIGRWPTQVHVTTERESGGRSSSSLRRHATGLPSAWTEVDGLAVTTLTRTVVDLARCSRFAPAVAVADAALRRDASLDLPALLAELENVPLRHGSARARRVLEFADGAADRPGESLSRANMFLAGLPAPMLQQELVGASGARWTVDFYWPTYRLIGEFDGRAKYEDPRFMGGRTAQQVLYDEKLREDDLRAAGFGFSRWPWAIALSPEKLRRHLVAAGLR